MLRNEEMESIAMQIEKIKEEMCDHYCKYQKESLERIKDPDDAAKWLMREYCEHCPLTRL